MVSKVSSRRMAAKGSAQSVSSFRCRKDGTHNGDDLLLNLESNGNELEVQREVELDDREGQRGLREPEVE